MPFVQDFASRTFTRAALDTPTVGDLADALESASWEPMAVTLLSMSRTIYVHPGQFRHLREELDPDPHRMLAEIGWVDVLGHGQLNVAADALASHVTRLLSMIDGSLAVVHEGREAVGVFVPSSLVESLPHASVLEERPNGDQVIELAGRRHLVEALEVAEANFSDFHSEGVNEVGPRPLACMAEGGHFVPKCPCRHHVDADCGRT